MTTRTNRAGLRVLDGSRCPDPSYSNPVLRVIRGGLAGGQGTDPAASLRPAVAAEAMDQTGPEILN